MAYTTVADVKTYVGLTSADDDVLITTLIASAQRIIDLHCRRTFEAPADTTRYFHAERATLHTGSRVLMLDEDLCQITSVTNGDGTVVAASEYVTQPTNRTPWYALELKASSNICWTYSVAPENAIAIVGRWSYSVTAPSDIVYAALRLVSWLYRQRDTQAEQERPIIAASGAMLMPVRLPADVLEILTIYRRNVV